MSAGPYRPCYEASMEQIAERAFRSS
jgi:hypothetical protein